MKKIIRFLGSIYFAIFLICASLLFVMLGTFKESLTDSHTAAVQTIYQNAFFKLLLFCFFINILLSSLFRIPFRKKHIPFLITHAGLLLILSGTILKSFLGVQGILLLSEGTFTNRIYIPEIPALCIEKSEKEGLLKESIPLKKNKKKYSSSVFPLNFQLEDWVDNGQCIYEKWFKDDFVIFENFSPIPLHNENFHLNNLKPFFADDLVFYAFKTKNIKETVQYFSDQLICPNNTLLLLKDENNNEAVINFIDSEENAFYESHQLPPLLALNHGFRGYVLEKDFLISSVGLKMPALFNQEWNPSFQWLFPSSHCPSRELSDWILQCKSIPHYKEAYWISQLFMAIGEELFSSSHPIEYLKQKKWPLFSQLSQNSSVSKKAIFSELTQQMIKSCAFLPEPDKQWDQLDETEKLVLYTASIRIQEIQPELKKIKIRAPLSYKTKILPKLDKIESNHPIILVKLMEDHQYEDHQLCWDSAQNQLKWPALSGKYLLRFQPHFLTIPYTIHLRKAKQILYPQSSQTFGYESDLVIKMPDGKEKEVTLSMNHVFETLDGYRFYLSTISVPKEFGSKVVQIIVNKDPFKYWLTYPGGILLGCGILFLFWLKPYHKK